MDTPIYLIALHEGKQILAETYELISFAHALKGGKAILVVLSGKDDIDSLTDEMAKRSGLEVVGLFGDYLEHYTAEAYIKTLTWLLKVAGPVCACIPHTSQGIDFAPQLSLKLDAACITAIEGLKEGVFVRSMFGGKLLAEVCPHSLSTVLTIVPGAWEAWDTAPVSKGVIRVAPAPDLTVSTAAHGFREAEHANIALAKAEVIVSAGRGVGRPENLAILKGLLSLFPKSAIGATRGVCDLGWLGYSHQIGSTGNSVSPKLYFACGISGAVQHVAGMKNSQVVVAVNSDPHAAIFRIAHYGIVEDLVTFLPLFTDLCAGVRKKEQS